jgi:hypothetical protein
MTPHQQAAELTAMAQDMNVKMQVENPRREHWEHQWSDCTHAEVFHYLSGGHCKVRIKPAPTIRIGDVEVPEPMRVAPARGSAYWFITLFEVVPDYWDGGDEGKQHLALGICQATEQGAKDMLDALVKQLGGVL